MEGSVLFNNALNTFSYGYVASKLQNVSVFQFDNIIPK